MSKTAELKCDINNEVSNGESIIINWNNWYFFPKQIINVSIIKINELLRLNNEILESEIEEVNIDEYGRLSTKSYLLPNTGSYSITITEDINPDHYFIIVLNNQTHINMKYLTENGLITKPIIVHEKPNPQHRITLISPKDSRPYGFSDTINVKYNIFTENKLVKNDSVMKESVSFHLYALNPNDPHKKEPRQLIENINNDIAITGLGHETCARFYTIYIQQMNYPYHYDSSQYFWVLPKKPYPLNYSIADINSKKQFCNRQNIKYGMFPTLIEFFLLLFIIIINIFGLILFVFLINYIKKYYSKVKRKKTEENIYI